MVGPVGMLRSGASPLRSSCSPRSICGAGGAHSEGRICWAGDVGKCDRSEEGKDHAGHPRRDHAGEAENHDEKTDPAARGVDRLVVVAASRSEWVYSRAKPTALGASANSSVLHACGAWDTCASRVRRRTRGAFAGSRSLRGGDCLTRAR